jgi:dTDP-glucose 4,6-dehydratase
MSRRVLFTGGSGFIGGNVLKYMLDNTDWQFTAICSWRHVGSPLNMPVDPRITVVTHDLTGKIPDLGDFDYIVNLASESHVDRSISDPLPFIENNVSLNLQLLEYARQHRPKVFLQFSTDEVYGAREHDEWDVLLPSNPYSASKASQEMICIAYWKTYAIPIVLTNSNNIVGPNQHPEKFVPKVFELLNEGKPITIHTSNGHPARRYWNNVDNVADALIFILKRPPVSYPNTDRPDRFNIPGGKELNTLEVAEMIAKIANKKLEVEYIAGSSVRPGFDDFYAETEGRLSRLGWKAPYTLEEALKKCMT